MTVEFFGEVDPAESKQLVNVPPSHLPSRLPALRWSTCCPSPPPACFLLERPVILRFVRVGWGQASLTTIPISAGSCQPSGRPLPSELICCTLRCHMLPPSRISKCSFRRMAGSILMLRNPCLLHCLCAISCPLFHRRTSCSSQWPARRPVSTGRACRSRRPRSVLEYLFTQLGHILLIFKRIV